VITDSDDLPGMSIKMVDLQANVDYDSAQLIEILGLASETFGFIGTCSIAPFKPSTSDIRESAIHGKIEEILTKPAYLYR